jgi:hypothetical protein
MKFPAPDHHPLCCMLAGRFANGLTNYDIRFGNGELGATGL